MAARRRPPGVSGIFAAAILLTAGSAHADDARRPDWAFGSPAGEGILAAVSVGSIATSFLPQHKSNWRPDHVQKKDRGLALASDVVGAVGGSSLQIGAGYVLESSYLAARHVARPGVEGLHGSLVEGESVFLTAGITTLMKRVSGRCRPWAYEDGVCKRFDAFPSGHTSSVSSIAGARLVRAAWTPLDDPALGFRVASFGLAELGAIAAAVLRVRSGAHSVEDVIVGAVIGHATGALVALAHPPVAAPRAPAATTNGSATMGLSFAGQF